MAARWNGLRTIQFVEYEPYAQKVLRKNFPDVPIHGDIKDFDATQFRQPFLCTGGYPCQPFSAAGLRRGEKDDRHLWPEMLRVIQECRPTWVLAENVAGHITMGLDEVLSDLEGQDYACQPFVIPACAKDASHRRDRVWIVAHTNELRLQKHDLCEAGISKRSSEDVADSNSLGFKDTLERQKKVRQFNSGNQPGKIGTYWPAERSLGGSTDGLSSGLDFPRRWRDGSWEEGIPRVTRGQKNRVARLKGLGNAVVPQCAMIPLMRLKEILL